MPDAKCPYCKDQVNGLDLAELEAQSAGDAAQPRVIPVVAYICPKCKTILSLGVDPRALGGWVSV